MIFWSRCYRRNVFQRPMSLKEYYSSSRVYSGSITQFSHNRKRQTTSLKPWNNYQENVLWVFKFWKFFLQINQKFLAQHSKFCKSLCIDECSWCNSLMSWYILHGFCCVKWDAKFCTFKTFAGSSNCCYNCITRESFNGNLLKVLQCMESLQEHAIFSFFDTVGFQILKAYLLIWFDAFFNYCYTHSVGMTIINAGVSKKCKRLFLVTSTAKKGISVIVKFYIRSYFSTHTWTTINFCLSF